MLSKFELVKDGNGALSLQKVGEITLQSEKCARPVEIFENFNKLLNIPALAEEHVWVLVMANDCTPVGFFEISKGSTNSTICAVYSVVTRVLLTEGISFVLLHNHTSPSPYPSSADKELTQAVLDASNLLSLQFCDHIIMSANDYYSFREHHNILA